MQSVKREPAGFVRRVLLCLPLLLAFVSAGPTALLQAASSPTAMADAARADDLPAVRKLIKEHADVNALANDGSSALLWAAYHSDTEMTKALLAARAVADARTITALPPFCRPAATATSK